jgi:hypothetical protein
MYTSAACRDNERVYSGSINSNFEAHGQGSLLYLRGEDQNEEIIISTQWKNNMPDAKSIQKERNNPEGFRSSLISDAGKSVYTNIYSIGMDTVKNYVLLSGEIIRTNFKESINQNPNARPFERIVGKYGYTKEPAQTFVYGTHKKQTYTGGDVTSDSSWKTIATSQLDDSSSKNSCYRSGDNFYNLKKCSSKKNNGGSYFFPF